MKMRNTVLVPVLGLGLFTGAAVVGPAPAYVHHCIAPGLCFGPPRDLTTTTTTTAQSVPREPEVTVVGKVACRHDENLKQSICYEHGLW